MSFWGLKKKTKFLKLQQTGKTEVPCCLQWHQQDSKHVAICHRSLMASVKKFLFWLWRNVGFGLNKDARSRPSPSTCTMYKIATDMKQRKDNQKKLHSVCDCAPDCEEFLQRRHREKEFTQFFSKEGNGRKKRSMGLLQRRSAQVFGEH
ncbi:uncharacterized protein LOC111864195 isoform X6 [Cryptotermes secundus]|uniref:uncharacterized protein LOC111864195 isoform X6 n=1 Tax=Cryptotermes secundus TaxID=105785 RepID=UPI000CD7AE3E|nr:uncharacterized protein LOC111864195 isoform X6 [Cryptotermes secundus]